MCLGRSYCKTRISFKLQALIPERQFALQVVVKDRPKGAFALCERITEPRWILVGREAQDIERSQQRAVLVIFTAQVHDLSHGGIGIFPRWITDRRVVCPPVGRPRHIAIDGDVQRVKRIGQVKRDGDIERYVLKLQRVGAANRLAQAVFELQQCRGCR